MASTSRHDRGGRSPRPPFARKRILIADDNVELLSILSDQLSYEGYTVTTAHNGKIACDKFQQYRFDAAIIDLTMPVMDGVEVVKAIRARDPHVFILIFSGTLQGEGVQEALAAGANKHIAKPFGIRELLEVMKEL
jgi:CheY-like chemotaxis protein